MPVNYHLRPFTPADYPDVVFLVGLVFGEDMPMNVETMRRLEEIRDPALARGRIVAAREDDGAVLGTASWSQQNPTTNFSFWVAVRPEQRRQGIGEALYNAVLAAIAPYGPRVLQTNAREEVPEALSFLHRRGFVEAMRHWGSRLRLEDFRPELFAEVEGNLHAQGIVIRTFAEIDTEPDARYRVYEATNALWQDVPSTDPYVPPAFEQWQRRTIEDPHFLPEAYFIAVDAATGTFVGVSTLSRLPESDHLLTGLTGVRREFRRRGIALALKVQAAHYAREAGVPVIRTGNATTNAGMLAINERLGFKRQSARIRFVRNLENPMVSIQPEPPDTSEALALIGALNAELNALYFPENQHGLSLTALKDASVVFLIARLEGIAVGCGAAKFIPDDTGDYAEIKRMYVAPQWRRRGVAQALLAHVERLSQENGYRVVRLGTGIHQSEAITLYERVGFSRCAPFGTYAEDGVSLCYEKNLAPALDR